MMDGEFQEEGISNIDTDSTPNMPINFNAIGDNGMEVDDQHAMYSGGLGNTTESGAAEDDAPTPANNGSLSSNDVVYDNTHLLHGSLMEKTYSEVKAREENFYEDEDSNLNNMLNNEPLSSYENFEETFSQSEFGKKVFFIIS